MTILPYKQVNISITTLPKTPPKKAKFNFARFARFFYRLDYLPPVLPTEVLGRQTIWQQLEQVATCETKIKLLDN